jgi:hypothetical protein
MAETKSLIDPSRLDLAREYRANPFGRHSPALQAVLNVMRRPEYCQDLILVSVEPGKWVLGKRLPDGKPPELYKEQVFSRLEDGEWEAFRRRWKALSGQELDLK